LVSPLATPVVTFTPHPHAPSPLSTPLPPRAPGRVLVRTVLRLAVFRDDDANALKGLEEPGLAGLGVRAEGEAWSEAFLADATGVVTIALPGPGAYEVSLAGYPAAPGWEATTRTAVQVRVGDDGSVIFFLSGEDALPIGVAEGVAFAFGLVGVDPPVPTTPVILWPSCLLLGSVLIWLVRGTGRARIAAAIRERVAIEKRLHEPQADLGNPFIEEDW
jgi:hypothetical protein